MKTYFTAVHVIPLTKNALIEKVEDARIFFWINDESAEQVSERVSAYLSGNHWELNAVEKEVTEVTAADFAEHEDGMMGFWKAKQTGFAARVVAKPKPGADQIS